MLPHDEDVIPISLASPAISKFSGKSAPGYRSLWRMIVDGQLTGIRKNGRWYVHVPQAARELGLVPETAV